MVAATTESIAVARTQCRWCCSSTAIPYQISTRGEKRGSRAFSHSKPVTKGLSVLVGVVMSRGRKVARGREVAACGHGFLREEEGAKRGALNSFLFFKLS